MKKTGAVTLFVALVTAFNLLTDALFPDDKRGQGSIFQNSISTENYSD
jgi:hypothetical protein